MGKAPAAPKKETGDGPHSQTAKMGSVPNPPPPSPAAKLCPLILAAAVLAGLAGIAGRLWLTSLAPRWAYKWDHFDNIQMGRAASQAGLFNAYGEAPQHIPAVTGYEWSEANSVFCPVIRPAVRPVNYPPLGLTLFWAQSSLLDAVIGKEPVNTFTSRLIMSIASVAAELAAAAGVFLILRKLRGKNLALLAAALCWVLPPMAMDSCFWGQTDAWFIAPALFVVYLMMTGRWVWAGVLAGATVLLKPQGIFLAPIVLFGAAILANEAEETGTGTVPTQRKRGRSSLPLSPFVVAMKRGLLAAGAGAAAILVLSLPWTVADGKAWIERAYLENITAQPYEETTLKAFNVWYLDALLHDGDLAPILAPAPLAPGMKDGTILGVAKDSWGRLLVLAALVALAWLYYKRRRQKPELALLLFSGLWLWSTFLWPTRVHERYILYAVPLVVAGCFALRRLWPAALVLAVVGTAELCHTVWLQTPPGYLVLPREVRRYHMSFVEGSRMQGQRAPSMEEVLQFYKDKVAAPVKQMYLEARKKTQDLEWFLTLACLLAYAWAFAAPFLPFGQAPKGKPPPTGKTVWGGRRR